MVAPSSPDGEDSREDRTTVQCDKRYDRCVHWRLKGDAIRSLGFRRGFPAGGASPLLWGFFVVVVVDFFEEVIFARDS